MSPGGEVQRDFLGVASSSFLVEEWPFTLLSPQIQIGAAGRLRLTHPDAPGPRWREKERPSISAPSLFALVSGEGLI